MTIALPDFVDTGTQARSLGPDGQPLGANPLPTGSFMSAGKLHEILSRLRPIEARDHHVTPGTHRQMAEAYCSSIPDRLARQAIEKADKKEH
ncbi:MAG: hypothetical protein R3C44_24945 [Chloroflexota bacterium]